MSWGEQPGPKRRESIKRPTPLSIFFVGQPVVLSATYFLLWLTCVLFGGSSRIDNPWLLIQRPSAVFCLFVFMTVARPRDLRMVSGPLLLLGALISVMLIQLVPVPPALWRVLPGRSRFTDALTLAGTGGAWLPLSLAPDRTWSSLAALITPTGVLLGYAVVPARVRELTLPAFIVVGLLSALLGLLQIAGGEYSALYYYPSSHVRFPIGFLANRNHEGALLALLVPALRAWSLGGIGQRLRRPLAAGAGAFAILMVFVTGSRAGLALLGVGLVAAVLIRPISMDPRRLTGRGRLMLAGGTALAVLLLIAVLASGRAVALDRLMSGTVFDDARFAFTPVVVSAIRAGFPAGWGFGTFDLVFRSFEPHRLLTGEYVNNAHDDLLELLLTGGLAGALVFAAFLAWYGRSAFTIFRAGSSPRMARARAAVLMAAMLLLASLTDYPLRSPLLGAAFALMCAWIADRAPERTVAMSR